MIRIGMKELERARRLQEEAAKLHIPSPPVVSYKISRTENGKIKDIIHAKSNSYVRNAYNALAQDFTFASNAVVDGSYFGDGVISYKSTTGGMLTAPPRAYPNNELPIQLVLGTNGTPDTLDDTKLDEIPFGGSMIRFSTFDSSSRRFITIISRSFTNTTDTTYEIREAGIYVRPATTNYLFVRDTFPSVTFAPGDNVTFTYQFEVYYPPAN